MTEFDPVEQHVSSNESSGSQTNEPVETVARKLALGTRAKALSDTREQSDPDTRLTDLRQLISAAAHELRGPLGAMLTSLHLVQNKVGDAEPSAQKGLERIRRSVRRCDDILTGLLDYSQYQALAPEPTRIDLWLRALLNVQTLPEGVSLTFEPGLGERRITVDCDRLQQAVAQVVENAAQAIVDGGTPGQVTVSTLTDGKRFSIRVADSGPGIPEEIGEAIFKPFFSTRKLGIGIGLAIARRIVEQHGGTLSFESGPTCFNMTLPAIPEDRAAD